MNINYIIDRSKNMAIVAQLVRASVCGTEGRGFESRQSPFEINLSLIIFFFIIYNFV